jgi:hypothetical protein
MSDSSDLKEEWPTSLNKSSTTILCLRPIVVRDGSIEAMALFQQTSSSTARMWFPESILVVSACIFQSDNKLHSMSFESDSRLIRIESNAFSYSSLQSIMIPSNIEIFGSSSFSYCKSFSSISFESNSRFVRIESDAFYVHHFGQL